MAAVDVRTMVGSPEIQKEKKTIHPFFGGPRKPQPRSQEPPAPTPTPKTTIDANTKSTAPNERIDLTISSPVIATTTKRDAQATLPTEEALLMKPDTNEPRRKRHRTSTIGAKDAETPISSHPSSSQDTALDLTPVVSRVTRRVIDELISAPPSQVPNNQPISFFTKPEHNRPASEEQNAGQLQDTIITSDTCVVADKQNQLEEAVAQPHTLMSTKTRPDRLKITSTLDTVAPRTPAKIFEGEPKTGAAETKPHETRDAAITSAQTSYKMAPNKTVKMLNFNAKSGTIGSPPPKKLSKAALKKAEKEAKAAAAKEETSKREEMQKDHMETKANDTPPKKPRRARKKAEPVKKVEEVPKSMIVEICYGKDEEKKMSVGYTIDAIQEGEERRKIPLGPWMSITNNKRSRNQAALPKTTNVTSVENAPEVKVPESKVEVVEVAQTAKPKPATKPAHPFFLGIVAPKPAAQMQEIETTKPSSATGSRQTTPTRGMPKTKTIVTPRKIVRSGPQGSAAPSNANSFAGFGVTAKMQKVQGALEPAWPAKGMVHVRGDMDDLPMLLHDDAATPFTSKMRKSKFAQPMPAAGEDIIESILARLNIGAIRQELHQVDDDQPPQPDKHLRLPNRGFESGVKLQRRISSQIKASISERPAVDDSEDELAKQTPGLLAHHAVSNLYRKIPQTLSAFDKGESDTKTWAQKYAPTCAKEVLQSGPDAQVLKSWLQTLTVAAVDSGAVKKEPTMDKKKKDDAPKRKRKKKLDGFIVDSDEEENEMEEIAPFDDSLPGSQGGMKTVIRRGDMGKGSKEVTKLMNAVLLSGPNGCGKTAAIYAVAKELDFEVFEINSSTRRSGKDILEKVGDMTKNHLVQHKKRHSGGESDEDLQRANEALDADLKSGRQGTMMSFFSKKAEPKPAKELKPKPKITLKVKKQETSAPSKSKVKQKQSLILLEEVDVIYEEDKEFWKTIIDLATSSKRPVIMTCNDESLVPKQALPLHAIIRLAPPPVEMAVDYLLLVAANEGHVLHRNAVTQLYEAHQKDLRSSFTELQFWCQFCVGDRRAGFDWFIPRWPKGQDLDAHGRKLRVISEGTYRLGMGMFGHDYLCSTNNISNPEEEMLKEAWDNWHIDAGNWHDSLKLDQWSSKAKVSMDQQSRMGALKAYEEFTDAMSTADICSRGWFGTEDDVTLDKSLPPTFPKALDDNVLGSSFVKADPVHRQTTLERDIAISMKIMAREAAQRHAAQYPNAFSASFQPITEKQVDKFIVASLNKELEGINRYDFGHALDPLATVDTFADQSSTYFPASVIDRTAKIIALDIAPYVRGIVAYDSKLAEERKKLSNLLTEGGRPGRKKMRTTRAAMSALEGGERKSTRKERWFGDKANSILVRKTGLPAWERALDREMEKRREQAAREREEAGVKVKEQEG